MPETNNGTKDLANPDNILDTFKDLTIRMGPSYANNFFFTIGIYLLELLGILIATGIIMVIFGPYWWNFTLPGAFIRSVHLWAAEAFVTLLFIHLLVNFATSAFKSRKLMWVIGCLMLFLVLLQFAFGV
jgi:quinol-cytochrome oxidoreductase complex cytochrome b subunit